MAANNGVQGANMMAGLWVVGMLATGAVAVALVRYAQQNRERIDRLETKNGDLERRLETLSEADAILRRAHAPQRRDRSHLKLLGLLPVGWLVGRLTASQVRLAAMAATSTAVLSVGLAAERPIQERLPVPGTNTPPAAAEAPMAPASESDSSIPESPSSTSPPTTSTTVPAVGAPPTPTAESTGPASPTPTTTVIPALVPDPSTTTTTVLPELPRLCLNAQSAATHPELCLAG